MNNNFLNKIKESKIEVNKFLQLKIRFFRNEAIKIATIYAVFGVLWILLSDELLGYLFRDIESYKLFQTFKGWFFILITTVMVYSLISRRIRLMQQDVDIVIRHLRRLKKRGIRIALDDFGTGYSSLNYLKKFPINIIKLDRSFIDAINEKGIDMLLIKNILSLAHDLEFEVIAEGIETKEQLEFLRNHFCESGQGYLLSRPQPYDKIHSLLEEKYQFLE